MRDELMPIRGERSVPIVGWASAHHWQRQRFVSEQTLTAARDTFYIGASRARVARRALPGAAA